MAEYPGPLAAKSALHHESSDYLVPGNKLD